MLANVCGTGVVGTEGVISELENLGVHITVQAVPNNRDSVIRHAESVGRPFESVTIAPNILEKMSQNSETRQKYVDKIDYWINHSVPYGMNRVGLSGARVTHMSMVIHEDGSTTYVAMGCNAVQNGKDDEESEEVFRYTKFGVVTIVYSCGKVRFESAGDSPELPIDYNHPIPLVASWDNALRDNNISAGNVGMAILAYSSNLRTASNG